MGEGGKEQRGGEWARDEGEEDKEQGGAGSEPRMVEMRKMRCRKQRKKEDTELCH